jgi:hypothetical protein
MTIKWLVCALKRDFVRSLELTLKSKMTGQHALVLAGRPLAVLMVLFLFPLAGYAYSLVLKNGRRVEIPDRFVVRESSLIYEAAPGISVSLQIATIDIEATELANREAPGSFFMHQAFTTQADESSTTAKRSQSPAKNVTNRDLEKFEQERLRNDETYDRDHQRRGLPSREELRRMERESEQRLKEFARDFEADRARTEALQAQVDILSLRQPAMTNSQVPPYGIWNGPYASYDGWPNGYYNGLYSWPPVVLVDSGFGFGQFGRGFDASFGFGQFGRGFNNGFGFGQFGRDRGFFRHENRFRIIRPPQGLFPGGFFGGRTGNSRIQRSFGTIGTPGIRTRR